MFEDKISILREIFPDFKIRKGYEFVTWCPKCNHHKMKLEINVRDNVFGCWVCGYKGVSLRLLKDFGLPEHRKQYMKAMGLQSDAGDDSKHRVELPKEYKFVLDFLDNKIASDAFLWLKGLNVSNDVIYQNRIGICDSGEYKDRILFPSFDEYGKLNYFVTRHLYRNDEFKWMNCRDTIKDKVFNELFVDWGKPLILVESVKGYLKHFERAENLVCCNGTKMSQKHALFSKIILEDTPRVYVAYDATADKEALHAMECFYEYGLPVNFVKFEDDVQPDHISTEEFLKCVKMATEFEKTDLLKNRIRNLV